MIDENEIEKVLANVAGTLAVEKLKQSQKGRQISAEYLRDKLTSQEAINKIKLLYKCKFL